MERDSNYLIQELRCACAIFDIILFLSKKYIFIIGTLPFAKKLPNTNFIFAKEATSRIDPPLIRKCKATLHHLLETIAKKRVIYAPPHLLPWPLYP